MIKISNVAFLGLACVLFAGCATGSNSSSASMQSSATYAPVSTTQRAVVNNQSCQNGDVRGCTVYADSLYAQGQYSSAIKAYDMNCARQDIPSCLKMAKMFEKGQGVAQNKAFALDIYTRACYGGDNVGCKERKRLL